MPLTDQFIKEREYFKGVSPKTLAWYHDSFKAFEGAMESKAAIGLRIGELRNRGVRPVSINTYLRCMKAYFRWAQQEGHITEEIKIGYLKAEQKVLATLSPEQIQRFIAATAKGRNQIRCHTVVCLILDTGLRISEALRLTREDLDFDNLTIHVLGKGGKHRIVPMSFELRKLLFRFVTRQNPPLRFPFGTRNNSRMTVRNFQRDLAAFGQRLGISGVRLSPHTLRHTFAVSYLRAGGNLYYLQRILGHSSITTTERYLRSLGVEDLQKVHNGLSLLARSNQT
jgi:site-specific recombinase XerD